MKVLLIALLAAISYAQTETCTRAEWCDDSHQPHCQGWADGGECDANPGYMHQCCKRECGLCASVSGWEDDIVGFAVAGGAHAAAVSAWAMFWEMHRRYRWSEKQIFDGKVISANSGGNWFVTDMVYDQDVVGSFNTYDVGTFKEIWNRFVDAKTRRAGNGQHSGSELCSAMSAIPGCELFAGACSMMSEDHIKDWKGYCRDINSDYPDSPLIDMDLDYYSLTNFATQSGTRIEKSWWQPDVMYDYGIEKNGQSVQAGEAVPVFLHYGSSDFSQHGRDDITIPKMEGEATYEVSEKRRRIGFSWFPTETKRWTLNIDKLKDAIVASGTNDAKTLSGPSSAFFGAIASTDALTAFLGYAPNDLSVRTLEQTWFRITERIPWGITEGLEGPLALQDGGACELTSISGTVYGLQKKDVHEGTIVAIMKSYIDLILLFSDTEFDRKSTANGPGQTAIFKGRWDLGAKKEFSYELDGAQHVAEYNIMEGVETIDNPRFGIVAGSSYRIIVFWAFPRPVLSLPLLLGLNNKDKFKNFGDKVMPVFQKMFDDIDEQLNTQSNIPTANANVRVCAQEGGACQCNGLVRYGVAPDSIKPPGRGKWSEWKRSSHQIQCNNDVFGDPAPFEVKRCECAEPANNFDMHIYPTTSTGKCPSGRELSEHECQALITGTRFSTWKEAGDYGGSNTCGCYIEHNGLSSSRYFNRNQGACNNPGSWEKMICKTSWEEMSVGDYILNDLIRFRKDTVSENSLQTSLEILTSRLDPMKVLFNILATFGVCNIIYYGYTFAFSKKRYDSIDQTEV